MKSICPLKAPIRRTVACGHGTALLMTSTQDRKCTYNVTLRRVRATLVAVEK